MATFAHGKYTPKNPQKYVGIHSPTYRSSWEFSFMRFCDTNPSIIAWASEPMKIPYRNPVTGKHTVYVPDFFIKYVDKNNKIIMELIEIKPEKHMLIEKAGKNKYNQAQVIINQAKWQAAQIYCKQRNITFRIITETSMFHNGK